MSSGTRMPKYNDCYDSMIQMKMRVLTQNGHCLTWKGKLCERLHSSGIAPCRKQATATQGERIVPCYLITKSPGYAWIMVTYTNHALIQLCQETTGYLTTQKQTDAMKLKAKKKKKVIGQSKETNF